MDNTTIASSTSLPLSSDPNDNNSERLKQQTQRLTHHVNGVPSSNVGSSSSSATNSNAASSNGHEASSSSNGNNNHFTSASTQTVITGSSYPSNGNLTTSRTFSNSQKEILRLIGQHLQSVGLR